MKQNRPTITLQETKPGDVVRPVDYENEYFFDMLVVENDTEKKQVRLNRPYAMLSKTGKAYASLEDWWLPYRDDAKFYLLTSNQVFE